MIRVLIKASSAVARAGLESLIHANPSFRAMSDSADETSGVEEAIADEQPDVVLAEIESRDDENVSDALDHAANGVPVILLVHGPLAEWSGALRQGIKGVLPSSVTGHQMAAAIEAAATGLVVVHPAEIESFFQPRRMHETREIPPEPLTPREIEVLRLLADGFGNKEIASRLGISEHTVKYHVTSIMGKLGAASRTEAVMLGIRLGIVLV